MTADKYGGWTLTSQQSLLPIAGLLPAREDAVTQFHPLTPKQAIDIIDATGVEDAAKLIRDHAAAGLVKSYAQVQVTIGARGERTSVRGAAVSAELWERMIREDVDCDAWNGGTVRLAGSGLIGGEPAVHITGIGFNPSDVERLACQQRPAPTRPAKPKTVPIVALEAREAGEPVAAPVARRRPDPTTISSGAILCTIKQAGDALGIGRTKVNGLMNSGKLERVEDIAGVRITVASVRALAGSGA